MAIAIALYSNIVTIWISSPALMPLLFDLKVKRKKKSIGIVTANPTTEFNLSEKIFFWVQKHLRKVFTNILVRDKIPTAVLAEDLNSKSNTFRLTSDNLVSFYGFYIQYFIHVTKIAEHVGYAVSELEVQSVFEWLYHMLWPSKFLATSVNFTLRCCFVGQRMDSIRGVGNSTSHDYTVLQREINQH
jgi:hypothetical protein